MTGEPRVERLSSPEGIFVMPGEEPRAAMLVLGGSSGRVQEARCRVLAGYGMAALSIRWFGDDGQPPTMAEVPVETFGDSLDRLQDLAPRLGVMGVSFGALAALLLGVADERLDLVVGLAPSHLVWASPTLSDAGRPVERSSFSWRGDPLHFMPVVDQTTWDGPELTTPRQVYEASLRRYAARAADAMVAVEQITARLLLSAGGDDAVWPSAAFADQIRDRREAHGLETVVVHELRAGHRALLPGEPAHGSVADYAYGGTEDADRRLGQRLMAAVVEAL